ncbi:amino acid ABC transporter membrane protein, PAAT family [Nakamurella panacisegetis]|uniref:Amino acid ABC transporter membrane protein, PAAT family n=1 Tax=Nakamurella panacisegetis TaxID=1090615 RepID=A0A1H0KC28_9ACTN|nr:amino acid ABC transporter permease [Nakamurella panacisegetis]SDO53312.1 amino acid ABC transporter membrane protein, PAAT family [Nakamurella panacisegetis]
MTSADGWAPSKIQQERLAYRRSRSRRSTLIAATSTVVLIAVVAVAVVNTQGWPRFKASFLDLKYGWQVLPDIAKGLWLNVRLMVVCEVIILVLAMVLAVARSLRGPVFFPVRAAATIYTDIFRGLPLLLVLYLLGFGVPALRISWLPNNTLIWGAAGLILTYTAYNAEVLRAGMESVHPSQRAAARSLGLSHAKTMRHVVIPQAFRRVMPPLLNDLVSLQKDTALIAALGTPYYDAVLQADIDAKTTYNYTPYVVAGLLFLLLTIPMTRFTDAFARRQGWTTAGATV